MAHSSHSSGPPASRHRLLGVDAARGVALIGMMSVHIIPDVGADGTFTAAHLIAGGRSAALFALLAGVGLALATGGRRPPRGRDWARAALGTVARALILVLVGLVLGVLDSGVAVILVYYGLLFLVATVFLPLGPRVLLPLAAVWVVAAPLAGHALRASLPSGTYDNPTAESLAEPVELVRELLLTGYYPVLPWVAYLLAGMGIGRLALGSARVAGALVAAGATLAAAAWWVSTAILDAGAYERIVQAGTGGHPIAGGRVNEGIQSIGLFGTTPTTTWDWLYVVSPHSSSPFDLAHTIGTGMAVLGVTLLLARVARWLVWPLSAIGSMTFTLYTLHVVLLATLVPGTLDHAVLLHVGIALAIAMPWRVFVGRGPLEAFAAAWARAARELVPAPHPPRRPDERITT